MIDSPLILLVEDNALDVRLLEEVCRDYPDCNLEFEIARSLAEAAEKMSTTRHDAVLLDLGLPESDGLATLAKMLELQPQHGHTGAIIVLTSVDSDTMGDEAIAMGAQDYLVKGTIDGKLLKRSIRYACERQRLAREQEESDARLALMAAALDQAADAVIVTDNCGNICYVNRAFTTSTGYNSEEAIGQTPSMLSSGKQSPSFYRRMWNRIKSGQHWESEMIDRRKNGELYPCHLEIAPITNANGRVTHFVGLQRDLTSHKLLENQMRQSQKMEAIGTLTGGIAHDFNNMLAGIMGNLFLTRKKLDDREGTLKRLDTIDSLCQCAAEMIKKMMAFGRNDMVQMQPLELNPLLKEIHKMMARLLPENITFALHCSTEPLTVIGDATQLHQILLNLINNARDAVTGIDRQATITLALQPFTPDEAFVDRHPDAKHCAFAHLQSQDNGCGADTETLQHLTEPFFTTKEVGSGTGLGLSMVDGAVAQHHGILELSSEPDQGMTIDIYLPLTNESGQAPKSETATSDDIIPGHGETILVVDDEIEVRNILHDLLINMGYQVVLGEDGQQAIELFNQHRHQIDLVIMDVVMPKMGGPDAYRQMQAIYANLPIIFASGYERTKIPSELLSRSYQTCLHKPFHAVHLSELIREVLA
ncbi:MAG: response regulator [Mariprofundales bacterium]